jgi:hypothetical protein
LTIEALGMQDGKLSECVKDNTGSQFGEDPQSQQSRDHQSRGRSLARAEQEREDAPGDDSESKHYPEERHQPRKPNAKLSAAMRAANPERRRGPESVQQSQSTVTGRALSACFHRRQRRYQKAGALEILQNTGRSIGTPARRASKLRSAQGVLALLGGSVP